MLEKEISKNHYYSAGKYLLSGEYLVLDGAKAIGLPCTLGQDMYQWETSGKGRLSWKSFLKDGRLWNSCLIDLNDWSIQESTDTDFANRLVQVLQCCFELSNKEVAVGQDLFFETRLQFESAWGLGSSSTFIANISNYFNINPYQLLEKTFGGSGYDIAAATASKAFVYRRDNPKEPFSEEIELNWPFKDQLFFVYLNEKQNSRTGIKSYRSIKASKTEAIEKVSAISDELMTVKDLSQFQALIDQHEAIISSLMEMPTVKSRLFSDFEGSLKSLGAWGGDFILAVSPKGAAYCQHYFNNKGYSTILPYRQIIKE